jgi:hypothetical protein
MLTCAIVNIKRGKVEDPQRKYKDIDELQPEDTNM